MGFALYKLSMHNLFITMTASHLNFFNSCNLLCLIIFCWFEFNALNRWLYIFTENSLNSPKFAILGVCPNLPNLVIPPLIVIVIPQQPLALGFCISFFITPPCFRWVTKVNLSNKLISGFFSHSISVAFVWAFSPKLHDITCVPNSQPVKLGSCFSGTFNVRSQYPWRVKVNFILT